MENRLPDTGIRKNVLLRTNLLVCFVILLGFIITTSVGYQANQKIFRKDMESVTTLTSDGIYHEIDTIFTKPINISLTMGNDSLLKEFLEMEPVRQNEDGFIDTMRAYLNAYREKYGYDSVFLASYATKRYYNFNGFDRTLEEGDPENTWFYGFLEQPEEYTIVIDNDQVKGAENEVTVFVNCRISDSNGKTIGLVGVGFRVNTMQELLKNYADNFGVRACLVDSQGEVQITAERTRFEGNSNFFDQCLFPQLKDTILQSREEPQDVWFSSSKGSGFVISRYVPNMKWHLIVEHDTTELDMQLAARLRRDAAVLIAVITFVLVTITKVIKRYNARIIELTVSAEQERRTVFQTAAEQLYEDIYEFDITHNRAANEDTARYFESLGAPSNIPYDKALSVIANKQIKEEYRQGYLDTFSPENVIKAYKNGTENLRYDFMISVDGESYYWMRITAHLFFWDEDKSLRMLVYRENIDVQMKRELYLYDQMQKDPLTGLLNKTAIQNGIHDMLLKYPEKGFAFFIMDIDDFKGVNDQLGHASGDAVLMDFSRILRAEFREEDLVGRIGGDEFVAFASIADKNAVLYKAETLVKALHRPVVVDNGVWNLSVSIGIARSPFDAGEFDLLYKKADTALYEAKREGKNVFVLYKDSDKAD